MIRKGDNIPCFPSPTIPFCILNMDSNDLEVLLEEGMILLTLKDFNQPVSCIVNLAHKNVIDAAQAVTLAENHLEALQTLKRKRKAGATKCT